MANTRRDNYGPPPPMPGFSSRAPGYSSEAPGYSSQAPPVPPHAAVQLQAPVPLRDVATAGQSEDVGIAMEHPQDEGTFMDVEIDPRFAMSFEYDLTFRAHRAARTSEQFESFLRTVYKWILFIVYNLVVFTTGLCLVSFWGIVNAITIYSQSWCLSPITRFNLVCLQGTCSPIYEITKEMLNGVNELMRVLCRRNKYRSVGNNQRETEI